MQHVKVTAGKSKRGKQGSRPESTEHPGHILKKVITEYCWWEMDHEVLMKFVTGVEVRLNGTPIQKLLPRVLVSCFNKPETEGG